MKVSATQCVTDSFNPSFIFVKYNNNPLQLLDYSSEEKANLLSEHPTELETLECPYPDLKSSVLNEFWNLTEKYQKKLEDFDLQLEDIRRWFKHDSLTPEYWIWICVQGHYASDLPSSSYMGLQYNQYNFDLVCWIKKPWVLQG